MSKEPRRREKSLAFRFNANVNQIFRNRVHVDIDTESWSVGNRDFPFSIPQQWICRDLSRERLGRRGILADQMICEPGIGLQRRRQRQMRSESVVYVGNAASRSVI